MSIRDLNTNHISDICCVVSPGVRRDNLRKALHEKKIIIIDDTTKEGQCVYSQCEANKRLCYKMSDVFVLHSTDIIPTYQAVQAERNGYIQKGRR